MAAENMAGKIGGGEPGKPVPASPAPAEERGIVQERVVKNAMIYLAAQLLSWAVAILSVSLIPNRLGAVAIGQMTVASTAVGSVASVLTLSLDPFLNAEAGRNRADSGRLLRAAIGLRLVCIPLMLAGSCIALYSMQADRTIWILGGIIMAAHSLGYVFGMFRSVLAGWEDARRVAVYDMLQAAVPLTCVPFIGLGVISFVATGLFTGLPVLAWITGVARRGVGSLRPAFDIPLWRHLIKSSLGFLVTDWVTPFLLFTTVFMLKGLGGAADVGVYSQTQKLLGTFMFVPTAIGSALLPSLARLADTDAAEFRRLQQRVLVVMIVLGMPIALLAFLLADPFCRLIYTKPEFHSLPVAVKFCGLSVVPLYVTTILYRFLIAKRRNAVWGLFMLGTVVINTLLCRLLIPLMQQAPHVHSASAGAILAFTVAETCTMFMAFALLGINPLNRETLGRLGRALLAAVAMAGAMWLTRSLFFVLTALIGIGVFGVLIWKMEALGRDEQQQIGALAARKFAPLLKRLARNRR